MPALLSAFWGGHTHTHRHRARTQFQGPSTASLDPGLARGRVAVTHGGGANTEQERNRQRPTRVPAGARVRVHLPGLVQQPRPNTPGPLDLRLGFLSARVTAQVETSFQLRKLRETEEADAPQISPSVPKAVGVSKPGNRPQAQGAPDATAERSPWDVWLFQADTAQPRGERSGTQRQSNRNGEQTNTGRCRWVRSVYLPGLPVCFASKGQESNRKRKQNRESGRLLGKQKKKRMQRPARQSKEISS